MGNNITYTQSPFNKTRKDKFLMVMNIPLALRQIATKFERTPDTILPDTLQFSVYGTVIPDISVPAIQTRYSGQTLSHSSHSREPYPPINVNFTVDNRFNNYWVIYTWLDMLNNSTNGIYDSKNLTTPTRSITNNGANSSFYQYKSTISIFGLDEYDKRVIEFKYTDAFPSSVGGINYSYRDAGEVESSFTLNYSQLLILPLMETESQ
jgi:hypothetical protein